MIVIKKYGLSCVDDVISFEKKLREQEDFWGWAIDEAYANRVKDSFADERFANSISLLAYEEGQVVGRIDTSLIASRFDGTVNAYLDWLCVLKSYRHKGIARQLMAAARGELKKCGAKSLIGIIAHNEESIKFYRSIQDAVIEDEGIRIAL